MSFKMKSKCATFKMKATERNFSVVPFSKLYKVVFNFESDNEDMKAVEKDFLYSYFLSHSKKMQNKQSEIVFFFNKPSKIIIN